jgi:hypothetical protein
VSDSSPRHSKSRRIANTSSGQQQFQPQYISSQLFQSFQSHQIRRNSESGFIGVRKGSKNKWASSICNRDIAPHFLEQLSPNSFNTREQAAAAYDAAARMKYGAHAQCNFATEIEGKAAAVKAENEFKANNPNVDKPKGVSGFFGVYPKKGNKRWVAQFAHQNLGEYPTKEEAAFVFDKKTPLLSKQGRPMNKNFTSLEEGARRAAEARAAWEKEKRQQPQDLLLRSQQFPASELHTMYPAVFDVLGFKSNARSTGAEASSIAVTDTSQLQQLGVRTIYISFRI